MSALRSGLSATESQPGYSMTSMPPWDRPMRSRPCRAHSREPQVIICNLDLWHSTRLDSDLCDVTDM